MAARKNPSVRANTLFLLKTGYPILLSISMNNNTVATIARSIEKDNSTVSKQVDRLEKMGFLRRAKEEEVKEALKKNKKIKHKGSHSPLILTPSGETLFKLIENNTGKNPDDLKNGISAMVESSSISEEKRTEIERITRGVRDALDSGQDPERLLRHLYNIIDKLMRDRAMRWYEGTKPEITSDVTKLIIDIPTTKMPTGSKVQGLRVVSHFIKSAGPRLESIYEANRLFDKLRAIVEREQGELGREAFMALTELRNDRGEIPEYVFLFYLSVLWTTLELNHMSSLASSQAQIDVLARWRAILTPKQKAQLEKAMKGFGITDVDEYIEWVQGKVESKPTEGRVEDRRIVGAEEAFDRVHVPPDARGVGEARHADIHGPSVLVDPDGYLAADVWPRTPSPALLDETVDVPPHRLCGHVDFLCCRP